MIPDLYLASLYVIGFISITLLFKLSLSTGTGVLFYFPYESLLSLSWDYSFSY